jgi:hypothetical protein
MTDLALDIQNAMNSAGVPISVIVQDGMFLFESVFSFTIQAAAGGEGLGFLPSQTISQRNTIETPWEVLPINPYAVGGFFEIAFADAPAGEDPSFDLFISPAETLDNLTLSELVDDINSALGNSPFSGIVEAFEANGVLNFRSSRILDYIRPYDSNFWQVGYAEAISATATGSLASEVIGGPVVMEPIPVELFVEINRNGSIQQELISLSFNTLSGMDAGLNTLVSELAAAGMDDLGVRYENNRLLFESENAFRVTGGANSWFLGVQQNRTIYSYASDSVFGDNVMIEVTQSDGLNLISETLTVNFSTLVFFLMVRRPP